MPDAPTGRVYRVVSLRVVMPPLAPRPDARGACEPPGLRTEVPEWGTRLYCSYIYLETQSVNFEAQ